MFSFNIWSLTLLIPCFALFIFFLFKKREILPLFIILVAIFVPKIPVINLKTNYFTGVRVEDLLILAYCFILLCEGFKNVKEVFKSKIFLFFIFYMLVLFISLLTGLLKEYEYSRFGGFLAYIRRIEYFCFIFAGYDFYKQNKSNFFSIIKNSIFVILIINLAVGIPQYLNFIGALNQGSYVYVGIAVGLFNGSYEIAAFCNLALVIYLYDLLRNKKFNFINIAAIIISIVLILLSKSRISLITTVSLISLMVFIYSNKVFKIICLIGAPIAIAGLILIIKSNTIPLFNRFSTINFDSFYNIAFYYSRNATYEEYMYVVKNNIDLIHYVLKYGDISFNARMFKWFSALELFKNYPLFGFGFSAIGTLDGNYVKMLCETGILGTVSFAILFLTVIFAKRKKESEISSLAKWMFLTVAIGSILIDTFEASKIMEPLWFFIGISLADRLELPGKPLNEIRISSRGISISSKGSKNSTDSQNVGGNARDKQNNKKVLNEREIKNPNKNDNLDSQKVAKDYVDIVNLTNANKLKRRQIIQREENLQKMQNQKIDKSFLNGFPQVNTSQYRKFEKKYQSNYKNNQQGYGNSYQNRRRRNINNNNNNDNDNDNSVEYGG